MSKLPDPRPDEDAPPSGADEEVEERPVRWPRRLLIGLSLIAALTLAGFIWAYFNYNDQRLAVSLSKKFEEAQAEFGTAIGLDPECFEAYYFYARACYSQGLHEKATELYGKAIELRPDDYQSPLLVGTIHSSLGRKVEAEAAWRSGLELAEKHLELHPDDARALYLGAAAMCHLGERARSLDWASRALVIDREEPTTLYNVACVYSLQGRVEDAVECLENSVKHGFRDRAWFENDPDLKPLHGNERFKALLEQL